MCGWLLLKEEPAFDKVSHSISEVTSGWQRCRSSGDPCSVSDMSCSRWTSAAGLCLSAQK